MRFKSIIVPLVMASAVFVTGCATKPPPEKVVLHVTAEDSKLWNQALNNAAMLQQTYGKDRILIEMVANGDGIKMLLDESVVSNRINDAVKNGIEVVACENTMTRMKIARKDMNPSIGYVPGGMVEINEKQKLGWSYIKP